MPATQRNVNAMSRAAPVICFSRTTPAAAPMMPIVSSAKRTVSMNPKVMSRLAPTDEREGRPGGGAADTAPPPRMRRA